jgi:hypothetical protein
MPHGFSCEFIPLSTFETHLWIAEHFRNHNLFDAAASNLYHASVADHCARITTPLGDVGNPEVIPRNVKEKRALPPQIARAASIPDSGKSLNFVKFSDGYGFAGVAVFPGENKFPWNMAEVNPERPRVVLQRVRRRSSLMPM